MDESPVFTKGALKKIVKRAKGIPRSLNILCDNTLITGFGYEKKPVNIKIVKEVMADFENRAGPSLLRWVLAPAASILLIAGLFLIYPSRDLSLPKLENPVLSLTTAQSQREEAMKPSMWSPGLSRIDQSAPVEEKIEREEEKIQPESEKSYTLTQRVKKGDNLSRLTKKVYGHADDKLIERVKQNNPRIKDVNHIKAGDEIVFPEIGENQVKSKG
jgi:general secretion pathway protein A